ncbi:acyl-CoA dehydrogenase [Salpingoeca rosetta]|uniref:Acyl-CoA dehydrogenase n=1 Tax=Salpingoeca rosetta (strain ATCC 50818 / BSB-021) TaxID=946362 RepID=F2U4C8_SALR5|nr:acyl-CoA dehydrogenase [Salpingoeca rosetta]EGD82494.1 acyl-CoA dehydrogenase [Salpingoeca rosetta]|eukprot:XP_004995730.1 acyl-CoA dehydrogenase [Salpingoeca rosetta]
MLLPQLRGGVRALSTTTRRQLSFFGDTPPPQSRVLNQVPALENFAAFESDPILQSCVSFYGADFGTEQISYVGKLAGSQHVAELARDANENIPVFHSHDRFGNRIDFVKYHPAYHEIMKLGIEAEIPSYSWRNADKRGSAVARSALGYLMYQAESGTQCPQTMTYACVPALKHMTDEQRSVCDFLTKAITPEYDPRNVPATEKNGITIGMSMTEKQGGSDVRANITTAKPVDANKTGPGSAYFLNGHKWFTSAPMCDAFLTLAQTENGLSCFIVPRWVPSTGERNEGLRFQRLKSKVGDRSNASSEVEYHNAYAELLGPEGRGIAIILEMVQNTRLDCLVGTAGLMKRALFEAVNHTSHRSAFGSVLLDTPLMRAVVADLTIESEAATALAFRIASTFDAQASEYDKALGRIATAIAKYHICKRAPQFVYEAMESLGGNGYVDEGPMGRLYRQAPLNAIWEGSGNVICLDVLRCFHREPDAVEALMHELSSLGHVEEYGRKFNKLKAEIENIGQNQGRLRNIVGTAALLLQAVALSRTSTEAVVDAFLKTRLSGSPTRLEYGALEPGCDVDAIITRSNTIVKPEAASTTHAWNPLQQSTRRLHTSAHRCHASATTTTTTTASSPTHPRNLPFSTADEVMERRAAGDWDCPTCGRLNFVYATKCLCGHARASEEHTRDGDWQCGFCGDKVFSYKRFCRCGEPNPDLL